MCSLQKSVSKEFFQKHFRPGPSKKKTVSGIVASDETANQPTKTLVRHHRTVDEVTKEHDQKKNDRRNLKRSAVRIWPWARSFGFYKATNTKEHLVILHHTSQKIHRAAGFWTLANGGAKVEDPRSRSGTLVEARCRAHWEKSYFTSLGSSRTIQRALVLRNWILLDRLMFGGTLNVSL